MNSFNYLNLEYFKQVSFCYEEGDTDFCMDITYDKETKEVTVETSHCGRGRGDFWTSAEVYETTKDPFFVVVQKWIKRCRNIAPTRIGRKETW